MFPPVIGLFDDSHSTRLVLKQVQRQIERIHIYANKSVSSSCTAILNIPGSVSLQDWIVYANAIYCIF